jgi:hypothetical protein
MPVRPWRQAFSARPSRFGFSIVVINWSLTNLYPTSLDHVRSAWPGWYRRISLRINR